MVNPSIDIIRVSYSLPTPASGEASWRLPLAWSNFKLTLQQWQRLGALVLPLASSLMRKVISYYQIILLKMIPLYKIILHEIIHYVFTFAMNELT